MQGFFISFSIEGCKKGGSIEKEHIMIVGNNMDTDYKNVYVVYNNYR